MTEIERIEKLRFLFQFNKKNFAKILGYANPQNYTNFLSGSSKLSMKMIRSLKEYDSRVHIDWILTGEGKPLLDKTNKQNQNITNSNGNIMQLSDSSDIEYSVKGENNAFLKEKITHLERENELLLKSLEDKERLIKLLEK